MKKIILTVLLTVIVSSCSKKEKNEEYFYSNPETAKKVLDDCLKWEKNLSIEEKNSITEEWYTGNVKALPKEIQDKLKLCETASIGYNNYLNIQTIDLLKQKLEYSMKLLEYCYNTPLENIPYNTKDECKNAEKAVLDSINGKIVIQLKDLTPSEISGIRKISYFKDHLDEAKEYLNSSCLDENGKIKDRNILNKNNPLAHHECLNADKAVNEIWIGSQELKQSLIDFMKDKKVKFNN